MRRDYGKNNQCPYCYNMFNYLGIASHRARCREKKEKEMNRPERKQCKSFPHCGICDDCNTNNGYNQACEDWEKYLPDIEELKQIASGYVKGEMSKEVIGEYIAMAIGKRLWRPVIEK